MTEAQASSLTCDRGLGRSFQRGPWTAPKRRGTELGLGRREGPSKTEADLQGSSQETCASQDLTGQHIMDGHYMSDHVHRPHPVRFHPRGPRRKYKSRAFRKTLVPRNANARGTSGTVRTVAIPSISPTFTARVVGRIDRWHKWGGDGLGRKGTMR